MHIPEIINTRDLARLAGVTVNVVRNDVHRGLLTPYVRKKAGNYYLRPEVIEYLKYKGVSVHSRAVRRQKMIASFRTHGAEATAARFRIEVASVKRNMRNWGVSPDGQEDGDDQPGQE